MHAHLGHWLRSGESRNRGKVNETVVSSLLFPCVWWKEGGNRGPAAALLHNTRGQMPTWYHPRVPSWWSSVVFFVASALLVLFLELFVVCTGLKLSASNQLALGFPLSIILWFLSASSPVQLLFLDVISSSFFVEVHLLVASLTRYFGGNKNLRDSKCLKNKFNFYTWFKLSMFFYTGNNFLS